MVQQQQQQQQQQHKQRYRYLSCCINQLNGIVDALVLNVLDERVFDRRIITFNKMVINKLYTNTGLACTNHHNASSIIDERGAQFRCKQMVVATTT
jgi:hypothetical protein